MNPTYITDEYLLHFIASALAEDVGDGDHSSLASISKSTKSRARLLVKDNGILAGVALAEKIFHQVDKELLLTILIADGQPVKKGDVAFTVEGSAQSILTAERLVLNCMQRMSAIATKTHYLTSLLSGTGAKLLDTRKTTPNFRLIEKWAVFIGGGANHRIGLFDLIMMKENNIDMAGGIEHEINRTND